MRLLLIALGILLVAAGSASGSEPFAIGEEPWNPPPWSELGTSVRRDVNRYSDSTAYEVARNDRTIEAWRWHYPSGSNKVIALVMRPSVVSGKLPAIVYCRGSYVQDGRTAGFLPLLHRLARAGYFVIAPQYRGSEGGTGRDEMGGADVEDVLQAVRIAYTSTAMAPVYLYGESRGGMMVFQVLRETKLVRAAATVGAFTDLDSLFSADSTSAALAPKIWPDYAEHKDEIALKRSALRWADQIKVPILLLHGENDRGVPARHSSLLDAKLKAPHELHVIPGGSHTLGEHSALRDSLVVNWFRTH